MKERLAAILSREESLFKIDSDDLDVLNRGRVLQLIIAGLVLPLTLLTISRLLIDLIARYRPLAVPFAYPLQTILLVQVLAVLTGGLAIRWLRQGRLAPALHVGLAVLDAAIVWLSLAQIEAIPYIATITLLPVLASAVLGSLRASVPYVAVTLIVLPAIMALHGQPVVGYTIINLVLVMSIIAFSDTLNRASRESRELTQDVMALADTLQEQVNTQTAALRQRADQLSHSVEVGRVASLSLDVAELVDQTTRKIRELFSFDEVDILLLEDRQERSVLTASNPHAAGRGERGQALFVVEESTLVGWVAKNAAPRVAHDGTDPGGNGAIEVGLPLVARGKLLGVLHARGKVDDALVTDDPVILQLVADQLAASLENARLFAESERRANLLGQLPQVAAVMSAQATTLNVLNAFALRISQLLKTTGASVWMVEGSEGTLGLSLSYVGESRLENPKQKGLRGGLLTQLMLENRIMIVEDPDDSAGPASGGERLVPGVEVRTVLTVPVRRAKDPVGLAVFGRGRSDPAFSGEEVQFAEALSYQLGVILQNNALLAEANRLAHREKRINEITSRLRGSLDTRIALETAAESLGHALGDATVGIRLFEPAERPLSPAGERDRPD